MNINALEEAEEPAGFKITRGHVNKTKVTVFGPHPKTSIKHKKYLEALVLTAIRTFGGYPSVIAVDNGNNVSYYVKDLAESSVSEIAYVLTHHEVFENPVIVQGMTEVFVRTHNPDGRRTLASCRGGEFSMELLMPIWVSGRDA